MQPSPKPAELGLNCAELGSIHQVKTGLRTTFPMPSSGLATLEIVALAYVVETQIVVL
jgi:hypothetical protein